MGRRSLGLYGVAACTLALAGASGASAATYCVGTPGCDAAHTKSTIAVAVLAASGDGQNDTVQVGSGSFEAHNVAYTGAHSLTIHGQGQSSTTINDATSGRTALLCEGAHTAVLSVRDLSVRLTSGAQGGIEALDCPIHAHNIGVNSEFSPFAEDIRVDFGTSQVTNSTLLASETASTGSPSSAAVAASGATLQISDSTLLGQIGLWADGVEGSSTIQGHRLTITASGDQGQAVLSEGSAVSLDDSLVQVTGGAYGLEALDLAGQNAALTARQLTLVGDGSTFGARASEIAGAHVSLTALDSIFRSSDGSSSGFGSSLVCSASAGGTTTVTTDYDDLSAPPPGDCTGAGITLVLGPHNIDVDPQFAGGSGAAAFELRATSPVRALDPSPLAAGESPTDLFGRPRIRGGKRDLGAFEYQTPGPVVQTLRADHIGYTSATLHGSVNPNGTLTSAYFTYGSRNVYFYGGSRTAAFNAGAGSSPVPLSAQLRRLRPGHTYHYAAIATSGVFGYGVDLTFRTKQACIVPRLTGKTLSRARRALRSAHCRLGRISHRHGRAGRVLAQSPHASRRYYPSGHKVNIILGR